MKYSNKCLIYNNVQQEFGIDVSNKIITMCTKLNIMCCHLQNCRSSFVQIAFEIWGAKALMILNNLESKFRKLWEGGYRHFGGN